MPWSEEHYPVSMKNLTPAVRGKAIEIANALLKEGYEEGRAISMASRRPRSGDGTTASRSKRAREEPFSA